MEEPGRKPGARASSERLNVLRALGIESSGTMLSRILGFVRDVVIALYFGAGMEADAFFAAFRIPNMMRRLFAEGSLTSAFIPVFSEVLSRKGKPEALRLARVSFTLLSLLLIGVSILGVVAAPLIIRAIVPGFSSDPEKLHLAVKMLRIMFPYILFISLVSLSKGVLNSLGHFAAPAYSMMMLNICMISSVLILYHRLGSPVLALAYGVILGGIVQLLMQVPPLVGYGMRFRPDPDCKNEYVRRIARLAGPNVVSAAAYHVNIIVITLLASLLAEGSISYLYYADRLSQLPLGIFSIALGNAIIPTLSRQAAIRDMRSLADTVNFGLRLVFFIMTPAAVGLIVLREPILSVLFMRGKFQYQEVILTGRALLCYGLGLLALSGAFILRPVFYSLQDTKTPAFISIIAIVFNILFCMLLMGPLGHAGLALAISISSFVSFILLAVELKKRAVAIRWRALAGSLVRICGASAAMGIAVYFISSAGVWRDGASLLNVALLAASITAGIVVFMLVAVVLRCGEVNFLVNILRRS